MATLIKLILSAFFLFPVLGGPLKQEWIELSYPFNNETIYWPTSLTFKHTKVFDGFTEDGFYVSKYDISGAEHGGTHLDAPSHFGEGKWTADEIPLDRLIGTAIKIDISSKAAEVDVILFCTSNYVYIQNHSVPLSDVILPLFKSPVLSFT